MAYLDPNIAALFDNIPAPANGAPTAQPVSASQASPPSQTKLDPSISAMFDAIPSPQPTAPTGPTADQSSAVGSIGRRLVRQALPTAGGFAGAGAGAEAGGALGGALGSFAGPVGTIVGSAGGGLAGGIAGFYGGDTIVNAAQDKILSALPDWLVKGIGQDQGQLQKDEQLHPYASMAGDLLPQLAFMRPGAIAKVPEAATAIEKLMGHPILSRGLNAGIGAAQNLAQQTMSGEPIDPTSLAINTLMGALFNKETGAGKYLTRAGARIVPGAKAREAAQVSAPAGQLPQTPVTPQENQPSAESGQLPSQPATPSRQGPESQSGATPNGWVPLPDAETGEQAAWFHPQSGEIRSLDNPPPDVKVPVPQETNVAQAPPVPSPDQRSGVQPVPAPAAGEQGLVLPKMPGGTPEEMAQGRGQAPQNPVVQPPAQAEIEGAPGAVAAPNQPAQPVASASAPKPGNQDKAVNAKVRKARGDKNAPLQNVAEHPNALSQPENPLVPQLRGAGDQDVSGLGGRLSDVQSGRGGSSKPETHIGTGGQQRQLRAGERPLGDAQRTGEQYAQEPSVDLSGSNANLDAMGGGNRTRAVNPALQAENDVIGGNANDATTRRKAAEIEAARAVVNTNPTEAQKEAGNYRMGHVRLHGLDISIENPKGSERSGTDPDGTPWKATLPADYGYIRKTEGYDGDHVDVFIGENHNAERVFVVDQRDLKTGKHDENKIMLGFNSRSEARATYLKAFSDGRGQDRISAIREMPIDTFKDQLAQGEFKKAPKAFKTNPGAIAAEHDTALATAYNDALAKAANAMKAAGGAPERPSDATIPPKQGGISGTGEKLSTGENVATQPVDISPGVGKKERPVEGANFGQGAPKLEAPTLAGEEPIASVPLAETQGKPTKEKKVAVQKRTLSADKLSQKTLLQTIKEMGGIRTRNPSGELTKEGQEIAGLLKDHRQPGLVNNVSGVRPDEIRSRLQQQGWFKGVPDEGADIQALYDHIDRSARGEKIYHPESEPGKAQIQARASADETQARNDIHGTAERLGVRGDLAKEDEDAIIEHMRGGLDIESAVYEHAERKALRDVDDLAKETGDETYTENDIPFEEGLDQAGGQSGEGQRGPESQAGDTGEGGQKRGPPEEAETPPGQTGREEPVKSDYETATAAHNAAIKEYEPVRDAYRKREIGDKEFLAAKAKYDAATKDFDTAFAKERDRKPTEEPAATEKSFADEIATLRAANHERNRNVTEAFARDKRVIAVSDRDPAQRIVLTKGTEKYPYRVTSFDGDTPTGHRDYRNIGDGQYPADNAASEFRGFTIQEAKKVTEEPGAEGLPQKVIPGAERASERTMLERKAEGKKKATEGQKAVTGLGMFGGEAEASPEVKKKDQGAMFARREEKTFYSALGRTVEGIKQSKAPADQWKNIIKNAQGVKREEVEWSGIEQWLDEQKGPVTKEAVQEFLRENNVDVQEVKLGGPRRDDTAPDQQAQDEHGPAFERLNDAIKEARDEQKRHVGFANQRDDDAYRAAKNRAVSLELEREDLHSRMVDETIARNGGESKPTVYGQYQIPGGENYRELLLTLPESKAVSKSFDIRQEGGHFRVYPEGGVDWTSQHPNRQQAEDRVRQDRFRDDMHASSKNDFRSGHFDEPNILAHVRFNDRTDADGKKVLFLEEVQSDWHQKGRRSGYVVGDHKSALKSAHDEVMRLRVLVTDMVKRHDNFGFDTVGEARGALSSEPQSWEYDTPEDKALAMEWSQARLKQRQIEESKASSVPNAPFKQSWHELAMKRMLRYAAEKGYDRVAWTTGEQQADRYDLGHQVENVQAHKNDDGTFTLTMRIKNGGGQHVEKDVAPAKLPDVVGKDLGEKIANQGHKDGLYSGVDLKVGGEGMKGFYDKILPSFLNKYAKKWGAKVGETSIQDRRSVGREMPPDRYGRVIKIDDEPPIPVHSIDVTEPMRASVMEGQPMFARGEEGEGDTTKKYEEITPGVRGKFTTEMKVKRDALAAVLRDRLDRLGLRDVGVRIADALYEVENGKVKGNLDGFYLKKVMTMVLDSKSPEFIVDHEAIHALRGIGLFTDKEWKTLSDEATKTWHKHFKIGERYADKTHDVQIEEAIAHAFMRWTEKRADGGIKPIFKRLFVSVRNALGAIANALRGNGFHTLDSIFESTVRGNVGRRGYTPDHSENEPSFARRPAQGVVGVNLGEPQQSTVDYLHDSSLSLVERLKGAVSREALGEVMDRFRTNFQDRFIPLLRTQQKVEAMLGRDLTENENAYAKQERQSGRIGSKFEDLTNKASDLFNSMVKSKVTREELEAYLYARHAPERNERVEKINPKFRGDMFGPGDPGSGMSNDEASAIMDAVAKSGKQADIEALASMVDKILADSVKERVDAGLMSQAQADQWKATWKNYVPLRGKAELHPDFQAAFPRTGGSFNIRGKESQMAFGRKSKAVDILPYVLMQAQEAIARGESNRVANGFYDMAKAAPDKDFWKVDKVETRPVWNKAKQQVEYQSVRQLLAKDKDYTISLKRDGIEHRVTLNSENPVAKRLAISMKGIPDHQVSAIVRTFGTVNRMLSHVNTTLNPEFVITNAFRDAQEALANLNQYDLKGIIGGVVKDYPNALRGAMRGAFGKEDGAWGKWYHEFRAEGGRVYFNQLEDIADLRKRMDSELKAASSGPGVRKALHSVGHFIERVNMGVENAIRLSAYKNAVERGMTKPQAASLAKNLTVNFNRRGQYGPLMNSLYLFYNASVQGSATLLTAMAKSSRVRKLLGAAVAAGAALEMTNSMSSGTDKDGELFYDKMQAYDKSRNLIIMDPTSDSGRHFKIPLPYGYSAFFGIGRALAELYRRKPAMDVAGNLATTFLDAFNPIGGAESLLRMISPTIFDPVVDLEENKDYAGKPIAPDQKEFGRKEPNTQRYWNNVSPVAKWITDTVGSLTGGDDVKPGLVDLSPEWLDYAFGQVTGAAGTFYERNVDLGAKLLDPTADITWADIPMARRVVGSKQSWMDEGLFYERANAIDQALGDVKEYAKRGEKAEARSDYEQNKALVSLAPLATRTRDNLSKIRAGLGTLSLAKQKGAISADDYNAKVLKLRDAEDALISQFNGEFIKRGLVPYAGRGVTKNQHQDENGDTSNNAVPDNGRSNLGTAVPANNGANEKANQQQANNEENGKSTLVHDNPPLNGAASNTELASAVKAGDLSTLDGETWSREDAIQAAKDAGYPATAALLANAAYPVRKGFLATIGGNVSV